MLIIVYIIYSEVNNVLAPDLFYSFTKKQEIRFELPGLQRTFPAIKLDNRLYCGVY